MSPSSGVRTAVWPRRRAPARPGTLPAARAVLRSARVGRPAGSRGYSAYVALLLATLYAPAAWRAAGAYSVARS
ncbi:hypothetical protein GTR02_21835, partial [Kineococcus sp. R8]|uniref:hypothetical protein n=1 Tax=Kineococcus siccus TaxID=2696567 RepID=UPI001411CE6D